MLLVPGGPMPSGLPNKEKQRIRQLYAEGKVGKDELLKAESRVLSCARHLHLLRHRQFEPDDDGADGAAHPQRGLHQSRHAAAPGTDARRGPSPRRACAEAASGRWPTWSTRKRSSTRWSGCSRPAARPTTSIHLPAIARAAGIVIDWQDFAELSSVVPLIARVYPNGSKDVNDFQDAGGMAFVTYTLAREGPDPHRHADRGRGLDGRMDRQSRASRRRAGLEAAPRKAPTSTCCARVRSVPGRRRHAARRRAISAARCSRPARSMRSAGRSRRRRAASPTRTRCSRRSRQASSTATCAVVVRFQGPRANGMPELHKLTPTLGVLQDRGHQGRADHRRTHVGRERQGAGGDPRLARGAARRAAGAGARRRHRSGSMRSSGTLEAVGVDLASRPPANSPPPPSAPAASCSR